MEVPASVANAEMFARARDLKLQVGCLTLRGDDTPELWQRCRDLGADWIMTDRPIDAARALQTQ
jgi:glycerophosphoryl diester phosphodiesterase